MDTTPHRITDENCTAIVISDLHKYSGISNFSKGDNPYFELYYAIYTNMELGDINKEEYALSAQEKKQIEKVVRQTYAQEDIDALIAKLPESKRSAIKKQHDPQGTWAKRKEIFDAFERADYVVLNGDIFDIECSINPRKKMEDAVQWLKARMDEAPDTKFHFVLGNHESFQAFILAMRALEETPKYAGQFYFHEHYFQLNDSLFVHGDELLGVAKYLEAHKNRIPLLCDTPEVQVMSNEGNRRRPLSDLNAFSRKAYEWFNGAYHRTRNVWHGTHNIVSTLYEGLGASKIPGLKEAFQECNHVFSGHTHEPYAVHLRDKYFYNSGAAVKSRSLTFHPICIEMKQGRTSTVTSLLASDKERLPQRSALFSNAHHAKRYVAISDLHLFADGISRYDEVKQEIEAAMNDADVIVLNGDIFDLLYPARIDRFDPEPDTLNVRYAMQNSLSWLRKLVEQYPGKEIHFVEGNHEAVVEFREALQRVQAASPSLYYHQHAFQPNDKNIFLHGDEVIDGVFTPRPVYNVANAQAAVAQNYANRNGEGIAMPFVEWFRKPLAVGKRIMNALPSVPGIEKPEAIENVFYGHTHIPCIDLKIGSRWVTNHGATTAHSRFAGVTFDMMEDGTITKPRIIAHAANRGTVQISGY